MKLDLEDFCCGCWTELQPDQDREAVNGEEYHPACAYAYKLEHWKSNNYRTVNKIPF